jgi:PAS domain S-box-containing protein
MIPYREVFNAVRDAVVVSDLNTGLILDANRAAEVLSGRSLDELRGLHRSQLHPSEAVEGTQNWLVHKDGHRISVETTFGDFEDDDGRKLLVEVLRDTTERQRAEWELLRENQFIQAVLENISDGVFACDSAGKLALFNRVAREWHGADPLRIPPEEWSSYYSLFGPDGKTPLETDSIPLKQALDGRSVRNSEMTIAAKGQALRHVLASGEPFYDDQGRKLGAVVVGHDITERKKAEDALQQRLQSYLDHAGDGIYTLEKRSGRILSFNKRAMEMLGYSRDELLNLTAADIEAAYPPETVLTMTAQLSTEALQVEGIHRRKDRTCFPVEIRMTSLDDHTVLSIVRDITERKRAEEERKEEARLKDEFLAVLGHELRNPLAAVSHSLEVLPRCSPQERASLEGLVFEQVSQMRRLIDDLLDVERLVHGRIELQKETIDLGEFLHKATAAVQMPIAQRDQELVVKLPVAPVQFVADRIRLMQVAENLLSNASKYTSPRGRIEFSGDVEGGAVVIRCKDNGQGITAENRERIFHPFVRERRTNVGNQEGSLGMGLPIVKQLAELHGGTVSVESAVDQGSEFIVRLPLMTSLPEMAELSKPEITRPSRARSILLVEDHPAVAAAQKLRLEHAGCEVHLFSDGPSALANAGELEPDAVLLDVGLPGMNGYELAARLRKVPSMRNAIFVAVTGYGRGGRETDPPGSFDHYFTKPIHFPVLLDLIDESILARASSRSRGSGGNR